MIRVELHKLIQERVHPISEQLLKSLDKLYEDYSIRSASTQRKIMESVSEVFALIYARKKRKYQAAFFHSLA